MATHKKRPLDSAAPQGASPKRLKGDGALPKAKPKAAPKAKRGAKAKSKAKAKQ